MKVANPIYDVVFKYLLADKKIAKLIISRIIGEEVISLEVSSTELQTKIETEATNFTVFHLDFAATLKKPDGSEELVIIEIQKAKLHTDIMRFRKYLGTQYQDKFNTYQTASGKKKARPLKTIYFLGHTLKNTKASIVKVKRKYYDGVTGEEITQREEFIESLTHDSFVIQIPSLKEKRRNNLEVLLSIFDQSKQTGTDKHYLEVNEKDFPKEFRKIIQRLLQAGQEAEVCKVMEVEDEILDELACLEREIGDKVKLIEEKALVIEEKEQVIEAKDKIISLALKALVDSGKTETEARILLGLN